MIKCINAKTYALTVGKEYEVVSEEGNYFFVHNDKNLLRRYYKNLFEQVVEQPQLPEYQGYLIVSNGEVRFSHSDFTINITNRLPDSTELACCGIREVTSIHGFLDAIDNISIPDGTFSNPQDILLSQIQSDLIEEMVDNEIEGHSLIISVVGESRSELIDDWSETTEYKVSCHGEINSNSGNMLYVYLITE